MHRTNMKTYLMEIITGDGMTTRYHGHTPYSNLAHKWARDYTEEGGNRVAGKTTTYSNGRTGKRAQVTELDEYQHEIKS